MALAHLNWSHFQFLPHVADTSQQLNRLLAVYIASLVVFTFFA